MVAFLLGPKAICNEGGPMYPEEDVASYKIGVPTQGVTNFVHMLLAGELLTGICSGTGT